MWIAIFHSNKLIEDMKTFVCKKNEYVLAAELTDSWCKDNGVEPSYDLTWEQI